MTHTEIDNKSINCGTCGHANYIHHMAFSSECKGSKPDGTACGCRGFNPNQDYKGQELTFGEKYTFNRKE